jgi:hypothetical protein
MHFVGFSFIIPSAYVPPSVSATKFHTHTKQWAKQHASIIVVVGCLNEAGNGEVCDRGQLLHTSPVILEGHGTVLDIYCSICTYIYILVFCLFVNWFLC